MFEAHLLSLSAAGTVRSHRGLVRDVAAQHSSPGQVPGHGSADLLLKALQLALAQPEAHMIALAGCMMCAELYFEGLHGLTRLRMMEPFEGDASKASICACKQEIRQRLL